MSFVLAFSPGWRPICGCTIPVACITCTACRPWFRPLPRPSTPPWPLPASTSRSCRTFSRPWWAPTEPRPKSWAWVSAASASATAVLIPFCPIPVGSRPERQLAGGLPIVWNCSDADYCHRRWHFDRFVWRDTWTLFWLLIQNELNSDLCLVFSLTRGRVEVHQLPEPEEGRTPSGWALLGSSRRREQGGIVSRLSPVQRLNSVAVPNVPCLTPYDYDYDYDSIIIL